MVSSGGRLVSGAGDGVRDTVDATGSWSRCIEASTSSFEYSLDSAVAESSRVPPITTTTSAAVTPA
jgi:hypothetical protein